jgi:hypothetical protein
VLPLFSKQEHGEASKAQTPGNRGDYTMTGDRGEKELHAGAFPFG